MGEFKIREEFKFIEVSPDNEVEQYARRAEDKGFGESTHIFNSREEPLTQELVRGGVDWIPRALLSNMVNQTVTLTTPLLAITNQSSDTFVVASSSDTRKPHIVNIFPNGKTDCSDCPGFKASSLCKHTSTVFAKLRRTDKLIGFLARTKKGKRGINFSISNNTRNG